MTAAERYRDILVIDLLGGLGDLVMVLPVLRALARAHPGAELRLLTHAPGDVLVSADPAVTEVRRAQRGREPEAVRAELDRRHPDLVVSTTRYGDIPAEIEARGMRAVTDLWRCPPPDVPVTTRYLQILRSEGLIDGGLIDEVDAAAARPAIRLTPEERQAGRRELAALVPAGSPAVLVPGAGMAVKRWPHWPRLIAALLARGIPTLVVPEPGADADPPAGPVPAGTVALPPTDLRGLAAQFAAVAGRGGCVIGGDTGPLRVAAAVGARTVGLFGPTAAARYGLPTPARDLQGLPGCGHRRPTAITEQVCWWEAHCPLAGSGPACMADIDVDRVLAAVYRASTA